IRCHYNETRLFQPIYTNDKDAESRRLTMVIRNATKLIMATGLAVALFIDVTTAYTGNAEAASSGEDCFVQADEARRPRPSGGLTSDGRSITYDYSNLPNQKKATFICVNDKLLDPNVPVETAGGSKIVPMKTL